ncbi:MAG: FAD-binding oxidoreductase [Pseudomonadota bacterium]
MSQAAPHGGKTRSFFAWGNVEDALSAEERTAVDQGLSALPVWDPSPLGPAPKAADYALTKPRVSPPAALAETLTADPEERLRHSRGRSYEDLALMLMREGGQAPDYVAYPETEAEISALFDWAASAKVALVPYGGGSSVCGGVDTGVGDGYDGVVSLDMTRFNRILEVDRTSRAARMQGGLLGPELEAGLRPHGLTLRYFPQSFEFSTLGGWIATRGGGHYATLYTHIDDFVESVRMVTPEGPWESRRLPGSGAGPSPDRLALGSEGVFGVITEAWMRLQDRPSHRGSASALFKDMPAAGRAARALAQSGLFPTNCRVLDPGEARFNGVGDGASAVLILGFESADHPVDAWLARGLEILDDHGGAYDKAAAQRSLAKGSTENRSGAAGQWRDSFVRAPYLRDHVVQRGLILDTFETAIPWDRFEQFYHDVVAETADVIKRVTGVAADVTCRLTHVYPDGAAPYFTYMAHGSNSGDFASCRAKWREIKAETNAIVVRHGGTVTHHHAVGRDHRSGYEAQTPPLYRDALRAVKQRVDPGAVLNPGVLIDAQAAMRVAP